MKVVVNTKAHYLKLSKAEMELICSLLGYRVGNGETGQVDETGAWVGAAFSDLGWFYDEKGYKIDWEWFRSCPTLVQLVEEGKLHDGLEVVEIPDDGYYQIAHGCYQSTGFQAVEKVYEMRVGPVIYEGERVVHFTSKEWYPKRFRKLNEEV
jgi:hypothetical protein